MKVEKFSAVIGSVLFSRPGLGPGWRGGGART